MLYGLIWLFLSISDFIDHWSYRTLSSHWVWGIAEFFCAILEWEWCNKDALKINRAHLPTLFLINYQFCWSFINLYQIHYLEKICFVYEHINNMMSKDFVIFPHRTPCLTFHCDVIFLQNANCRQTTSQIEKILHQSFSKILSPHLKSDLLNLKVRFGGTMLLHYFEIQGKYILHSHDILLWFAVKLISLTYVTRNDWRFSLFLFILLLYPYKKIVFELLQWCHNFAETLKFLKFANLEQV